VDVVEDVVDVVDWEEGDTVSVTGITVLAELPSAMVIAPL